MPQLLVEEAARDRALKDADSAWSPGSLGRPWRRFPTRDGEGASEGIESSARNIPLRSAGCGVVRIPPLRQIVASYLSQLAISLAEIRLYASLNGIPSLKESSYA